MRGIAGLIHIIICIWAVLSIWGAAATGLAKIIWSLAVIIMPVLGLIAWLIFGPGSPV